MRITVKELSEATQVALLAPLDGRVRSPEDSRARLQQTCDELDVDMDDLLTLAATSELPNGKAAFVTGVLVGIVAARQELAR